jgi:hypothetical protein
MDNDSNKIVKDSLMGLIELGPKEGFERPSVPRGDNIFPPKQPVDLVDDISMISVIDEIISSTKNKEVYSWCCLILNRLLKNTKYCDISFFLIDKIKQETELWKLKKLVSPIAVWNPCTNKVSELVYLLEHKNNEIRHGIINALKDCTDPNIEEPLLGVLNNSKNAHEIYFTLLSLRNVATKKSLDSLYPLLTHKKQDVKMSSLSVISKILKSEGSDFFINLLSNKTFRDKDIVTLYIRNYCKEKGVSPICNRIKSILSRKRGRPLIFRRDDRSEATELILNTEFLSKYYDSHPEVERTFQLIEKKWDNVFDSEKEEIENIIVDSRVKSKSHNKLLHRTS